MLRRHFSSRLAIVLATVVTIVGAAVGGFDFLVVQHFDVPPPQANYPRPQTLLEAQKQDLDYFGKLMALDRSHTPQARKRAEEQLARLKKLDQPLSLAKLKVALMQIIALADNCHSRISGTSDNPPILVEPIRIAAFSDGFYVMRAKQALRRYNQELERRRDADIGAQNLFPIAEPPTAADRKAR